MHFYGGGHSTNAGGFMNPNGVENVYQRDARVREIIRQCPGVRPDPPSGYRDQPLFNVPELKQNLCRDMKSVYANHYNTISGLTVEGRGLLINMRARFMIGMNMISLSSMGCTSRNYHSQARPYHTNTDGSVVTIFDNGESKMRRIRVTGDRGDGTTHDVIQRIFSEEFVPSNSAWDALGEISRMVELGASDSRRQDSIDVGNTTSRDTALWEEQIAASGNPQYYYLFNVRHPADSYLIEEAWDNVAEPDCGM